MFHLGLEDAVGVSVARVIALFLLARLSSDGAVVICSHFYKFPENGSSAHYLMLCILRGNHDGHTP
jgi:hypothetical protein